MTILFRFGNKVVASVVFVWISVVVGTASAQSDVGEIIDYEFFHRNVTGFMAACLGEPIILPISDKVSLITQPDSYLPSSGEFQSASVANNCSILFTSLPVDLGKTIPSGKSLAAYLVNLRWLKYTALRSHRAGEPYDFASILASKTIPRRVTFYTDKNRSGAFEVPEQINTEGLDADQIIWEYPMEKLVTEDFGNHFARKSQYTEFGGVFLRIARFENGPLNGRGLYVVTTLNGWGK